MEFPFESLEVYQKGLNLYRMVNEEGGSIENKAVIALKRGIIELCQSIVTGASCWSRENKVRYFLNALDRARCLTPLVEGTSIEGCLKLSTREKIREEIENLCKMLSSLARRTREWVEKTDSHGTEEKPSPPKKEK